MRYIQINRNPSAYINPYSIQFTLLFWGYEDHSDGKVRHVQQRLSSSEEFIVPQAV